MKFGPLTALSPSFKRYVAAISDGSTQDGVTRAIGDLIERFYPTDTLAEAHGIWFDCPLCSPDNPHGVLCWFPNAPLHPATDLGKNNQKQPVRWSVSGTDYSNLSLSPSIQIQGGCNWHGFITNGIARNA